MVTELHGRHYNLHPIHISPEDVGYAGAARNRIYIIGPPGTRLRDHDGENNTWRLLHERQGGPAVGGGQAFGLYAGCVARVRGFVMLGSDYFRCFFESAVPRPNTLRELVALSTDPRLPVLIMLSSVGACASKAENNNKLSRK